ncbi:MAG: dephospho-CoA kinase [Desulfobacteraceae bacterium]|nr:dephospho-CoA kinase [Desulfobacteraceae bacterium]MBC2753857.1 dephospho-CoA kinase [Desulfobacteraceae bacterium]
MEPDISRPTIAGLTGGIASGKSTVAAMLAEAGARIVDADRIAHQVVMKGQPAWQDIVDHFGKGILARDGQIDREALGSIVFNDTEAKKALNGIVHPRVFETMAQEIQSLAEAHPGDLVIMDVPLLIESGLHASLPIVILVYVPETMQQERLMRRDGLNAADAAARIRSQMPIDAKRAHAHYIVDNTGDLGATRRQVLDIYRTILSGAPPPKAAVRQTPP